MTSALRGRGPGKADEVRELSKGGCVNMQTRVRGFKKLEIFANIINERPHMISHFHIFLFAFNEFNLLL